MRQPIFITGIGTGIGKTVISAIVTEALEANYWKPVQAGFDDGTDALSVKGLLSNTKSVIHPEIYKLKLPASPHIAAKEEGVQIDLNNIKRAFSQLTTHNSQLLNTNNQFTIIEGAGGLLVPLNGGEFIIDLIKKMTAKVILISRNYLGSINHSLLTAQVCKANNIDVLGWIFNDQYMHYEEEIATWSGYPKIGSVPFTKTIDKAFVKQQAERIRASLTNCL